MLHSADTPDAGPARGAHAQVAVKVILKANVVTDRQTQRVQKEVRFLKLLRHPNIVKVHDIYETEEYVYVVMEYASGGELFEYIVTNRRLRAREARLYFRQILSAVDYCHQVRPQNRSSTTRHSDGRADACSRDQESARPLDRVL